MGGATPFTPKRGQGLVEGVVINLPLFRHAPRARVAELARQARAEHIARGGAVVRRGDTLPGFYAVAYGMVKLSLRTDLGDERVLRLVGAGETFGEAVMFLERPCPVDAVALDDSLLVVLPVGAVFDLIEHDARFARCLIANLSERMHALVADIEASTLQNGLQRVAAYLEAHCSADDSGRACVRLPATKTVVASHLGVTKETFSRLLRELARLGLIEVTRREIGVSDLTGLRSVARQTAASR